MEKQKAIQKSLLDAKAVNAYINYNKITGQPYSVTYTNYTTKIEGVKSCYFVSGLQSFKAFSAYQKVKQDILKRIPESSYPVVNMNELMYYKEGLEPGNFPEVFNVDLKNAYAQLFFNTGIITKETFAYLRTLPKKDRLVSLGMLASRKRKFTYIGEQMIEEPIEIKSPLSSFFFYAVQSVGVILNRCREIAGNDFLFFWVDGIYLKTPEKLPEIENYLNAISHPYAIENLTNWNCIQRKNLFFVTYKKDGNDKTFFVPRTQSEFSKRLIQNRINPKY